MGGYAGPTCAESLPLPKIEVSEATSRFCLVILHRSCFRRFYYVLLIPIPIFTSLLVIQKMVWSMFLEVWCLLAVKPCLQDPLESKVQSIGPPSCPDDCNHRGRQGFSCLFLLLMCVAKIHPLSFRCLLQTRYHGTLKRVQRCPKQPVDSMVWLGFLKSQQVRVGWHLQLHSQLHRFGLRKPLS